MNCKTVHSVWALICCPRKLRSGAQTLFMALLLSCAVMPARADCPAAPIGDPDDMAISFLKAHAVQAASASLLASSVKQGTLVYDNAANKLKFCDGNNWLDVGGGPETLAALMDIDVGSAVNGDVLTYDSTVLKWKAAAPSSSLSGGVSGYLGVWSDANTLGHSDTSADHQLFWDGTNYRLGIGTANPESNVHIQSSGNTTLKIGSSYPNSTTTGITIDTTGDVSSGRLVFAKAGTTRGGLQFAHNASGVAEAILLSVAGGTPKFAVLGSGNVGIGTVHPQSKLQVAGGIQLADDADTCPGASNVKLGTLKYVSDSLSVCKSTGWAALNSGGGITPAGYDGSIQFKSSSVLAADPANLYWDDTNSRLVTATLKTTGAVIVGGFDFLLGNGDQVTRGNSGNSRALVKGSGAVLSINHLGDFVGGTIIQGPGGGPNFFVSATNNGNVGIGTKTPQSRLHVAGGIQLADDAETCPGTGSIKLGTLKYVANTLSVCNSGGWTALATSTDSATLDGLDSTQFLRSDTADTASGQITFSQPLIVSNTFNVNGSGPGEQNNGLYLADLGTTQGSTLNPTYTTAIVGQVHPGRSIALSVDVNGYLWGFRSHANPGTYTFSSKTQFADNAGLLNGWNATTAATPSTIMARDGNGDTNLRYLQSTYVSMSHAAAARNTDSIFYSSTDSYIRKNTAAGFRTSLDVYSKSEVNALAAGDNLGNHTATTTLAMGNNAISSSAGTVIDANGGWHRSYGSTGWYNGTYGGGWYMTDSTYIRNYGSKQVYLNANITAPQFLYASDARLKYQIESLPDALENVSQIRGVSFRFRTGDRGLHLGIIAQDVQKVYPQAVVMDGKGFLRVDYPSLIGPLIEAVKTLKAENQTLRDQLGALSLRIDTIDALVSEGTR